MKPLVLHLLRQKNGSYAPNVKGPKSVRSELMGVTVTSRLDEGLMLETSALKLFKVDNLRYQLS